MTLGEAQDLVARCGLPKAPPVAGKLYHAWDGWADIGPPAMIIYTHEQYDEARALIVDEVARLNQG